MGHRCKKLRLPCFQALDDKPSAVAAWLDSVGVSSAECAYMGNDVNDLAAMELVGLPVAPIDAHPRVIDAAEIVVSRPGGGGAVAELAELLLQYR